MRLPDGGPRVLWALALVVMAATATSCRPMTPLHEAALLGDVEVVKVWIAQKRNLDVTYDVPSGGLEGNVTRERGVTPLMLAATAGRLEIVKLLVEAGAGLYAESRWRDGSNPRTAFDYAVEGRHTAIVAYLWTKSDGVRFASRLARHIAGSCMGGCDDTFGGDARTNLALFLISIARDDAVLGKGLGEAVCYARQPLRVLAFLDRHAVRIPRNTLHCIAYRPEIRYTRPIQERLAVASILLDRGADPNDLPHTPLRGAAAGHDLDMVKLLLARGADPALRNGDGLTAIGAAANSCVYGAEAAELEAKQRPQLAVIEHLAHVDPGAIPRAIEERSRLGILTSCCARTPHTETQRRICALFGL